MDHCLANPSPSIILIWGVESHEWDKLNARVASRRPNNDKADQLSINLLAWDDVNLENQST